MLQENFLIRNFMVSGLYIQSGVRLFSAIVFRRFCRSLLENRCVTLQTEPELLPFISRPI
jgi:hypothetical protein